MGGLERAPEEGGLERAQEGGGQERAQEEGGQEANQIWPQRERAQEEGGQERAQEGGQERAPYPGVRSVQINFQLFAIYHPFGAYTGSGVNISHRVILVKTRSGRGVWSALKRGGVRSALKRPHPLSAF